MHKTIRKYCRDCVVAFLVISLFTSPLTIAVEQDSIAVERRMSRTTRQRLRTRITYSCTEKPIETVLMELAEQAQVDIIKSPKVTGNVTAKVTDVPLEEALTNILAAHDFTYIATESMIRVVPLPEITVLRESLVTRIYQITYADTNEVATALSGFVSQRGKVAMNNGTSHIIVTDTEDKIKAIDKFIEQIDLITPQVLVEVRIYDITSNEGFELGAQWHAGRNAPMTADTILLPTETTKTLIGPSLEGFYENRTDITQTGDVTTTTTMPETTTIFDEDRTDRRVGVERGDTTSYTDIRDEDSITTDSGFTEIEIAETDDIIQTIDEYSGTTYSGRTETENTYLNPPPIITNRRRKPFVGGSFDSIRGGSLRFSLLNDMVNIDLALSILHREVEAKLLANPRVLVLDNETANFEIIREVPYRELRQVARENPITYTEFKDVGVRLKVTPHIARDGMIRLHIMPEFGVLVSQNAVSVLTTKDDFGRDVHQNVLGAPTVDTRRADTTALIRDGQTIVIGGLRKRQTSKNISKVPVLGDIPLVGGLFKSETESVQINELVIFITTRIVTEPVLSGIERKQFEATKFASPRMTKMRLERNNQLKPTVDKFEVEELTELIDQLLRK